MKHYFSTLSVLALSVMGFFAPNAKATQWDRKTNITINQQIEVEGTVLPAGSYVIQLVDLTSERHLVRILNVEQNHVFKTLFATPTYTLQPSDNSRFEFYESDNGQPPALHTWFYPGEAAGFEFKPSHANKVMDPTQGASATASSTSTN